MSNQTLRLVLLMALFFTGLLLFNHWQRESALKANQTLLEKKQAVNPEDKDIPDLTEISKNPAMSSQNNEVPNVSEQNINKMGQSPSQNDQSNKSIANANGKNDKEKEIREVTVKTDVLNLKIDLLGGDLIYLNLPKYPEGEKNENYQPYVLFDRTPSRFYIAQTGLTGEDGPDIRGKGRAKYTTKQTSYELANDQDRLEVLLETKSADGNVDITKRYVFYRGQYVIDIEYLLDNNSKTKTYQGNLYGRLKRKPEQSTGSSFFGIQTYTGAAVHTNDTKYKKLSFKDIAEKPFSEEVKGGWAAMVEHYFVSALVPEPGINYNYHTAHLDDGTDAIGFIAPTTTLSPTEQDSVRLRLYAGPEITETLEKIAPGLELSVDYGVLWPICQPIFWLLKKINEFVGNWGWSIVIITILIKLLFYKLSATSYRSMGNMRKLQPKIETLKERYGEDKQKFSQAVMELYKKEKINPLGGCLPIVVQIPVFIALYYVLLGSVELRHAPFILWIHDLSVKDPYYVLPILMGISMLVQQKLNPPPPDPVQAKVMMFMPVIFTVLFLNFPAGLVLYWFVNNVLSILQQWFITWNIGRTQHGAS